MRLYLLLFERVFIVSLAIILAACVVVISPFFSISFGRYRENSGGSPAADH